MGSNRRELDCARLNVEDLIVTDTELDQRASGISLSSEATDPIGIVCNELDVMRSEICGFKDADPDRVLYLISGISARLTEIRASLQRTTDHRANALVAKEVDPLRQEIDLQFRVHSRRIAMLEWELNMTKGAA